MGKKIIAQSIKDQIVDLYINKKESAKQIGTLLKLGERMVLRVLHEVNVVRPVGKTYKYSCNDRYFENIDTEHKAYWLGVLYADGNVSKNNCGTGQVFLSSTDNDWIQLFLDDIESDSPVYIETHKKYNKTIGKAHITSDSMFEDLCKLGCIPKKSLLITFPKIKDDLIRHFIRGYFDGDGTIGIYKYLAHSNSKTLKSGICSGSKVFLEQLIKFLPTLTNNVKNNGNIYTVNWSVNDTLTFCTHIYTNSTIALNRKKDIIHKFLEERRSTTIMAHLKKLDQLENKMKV